MAKKEQHIKKFDQFRFEGLDPKIATNKYLYMNRVNADETKVIVRFSKEQVFKTSYGYGFIVGQNHIVWLKDWQVEDNYYSQAFDAYEILLNKEFYNVKDATKPFDDIYVDNDKGFYDWDDIVAIAKEQQEAQKGVSWLR